MPNTQDNQKNVHVISFDFDHCLFNESYFRLYKENLKRYILEAIQTNYPELKEENLSNILLDNDIEYI